MSATCRFEALESRELFSAGALDSSFAGGGMTTLDFGHGISATSRDAVVQSDGKTIVVGQTSDKQFAIARFNLDGTPDTSFGPNHNGTITARIGGSKYESDAQAVIIDNSGNIIVGGFTRQYDADLFGYNVYFAMAKYKPNGALDTYFGEGVVSNGYIMTDMDTDGWGVSPDATIKDMALGDNGKIIVAGDGGNYTLGSGNMDMIVAQFNANGTRDESFGDDGKRFVGFGGHEFGNALAIDRHGNAHTNPYYGDIVVVGESDDHRQFAISRLKPNGDFDNRLDGDGKVTVSFNGATRAIPHGVTVESGGRIVVAGTVLSGSGNDFGMVRLLPSGQVDSSFGSGGRVITNFGGNDQANDVLMTQDGHLLVGGSTNSNFAIAKYNADGILDTTFGNNGLVVTPSWEPIGISRLAAGPGGHRFVAVGGSHFETARYLDAGANLVYAATLNPNAYETGNKSTSFLVYRQERLPTAARVHFTISGTATAPNAPHFIGGLRTFALPKGGDYTLSGVGYDSEGWYVDIGANQTIALVTVTPTTDTLTEPNETAKFTLSPSNDFDLGTPSDVTITIHDSLHVHPLTRSLASDATKSVKANLFSQDRIALLD
jgi:uncharacterized delta-60 repeat protein